MPTNKPTKADMEKAREVKAKLQLECMKYPVKFENFVGIVASALAEVREECARITEDEPSCCGEQIASAIKKGGG